MISDQILDWLQAPMLAIVDMLPASVDTSAGDLFDQLTGLAGESTSIVEGGPGVLVNMALLVAMVTTWLLVDAGIFVVRTLIWVKKVILF